MANEHRRIREVSAKHCDGKVAFESQARAAWAKKNMAESGLRVYRCTKDHTHWHVGRIHAWQSKGPREEKIQF